ncbi:hypothetical protein HMPREF1981_03235 [Bacteroides pyogenes F0041]|uniref:Uncharacterized protein n=1 Tax=Bacteroides pyogenes F0041 TaxID=1321819 RepID=U2DP33_9BACE|nr:hypothetical protein HMPREF1981_03235 [Bacteroides pyogenes F0041]
MEIRTIPPFSLLNGKQKKGAVPFRPAPTSGNNRRKECFRYASFIKNYIALFT